MTETFDAHVHLIDEPLAQQMRGRSWREDPRCPPFPVLRRLQLRHWTTADRATWGELIVAERVVGDLLSIFAALFRVGFVIERMQPVDAFDGDDDASMAANNSSAFNFRTIAGSDLLSHHALGVAVDLNPRTNPMFIGERVEPENGLRVRDHSVPGVILRPGPVVEIFERHGWYWGGDWPDLHDTHHFSALPRDSSGDRTAGRLRGG